MPTSQAMELLDLLYQQAQRQSGNSIKSRWFHNLDPCPGCGRKVGAMKWKGEDALSLNAFIFREYEVLIGYLLCGKCGKKVICATETTPLHLKIEETLKKGYLSHLGH
jgi:hypothetical protein